MSRKDRSFERRFVETNPGVHPRLRDYFKVLNRDLRANDIWSTTTTTTSSTTSSTTSTSSSTSTTSSTTTTTTA